MGTCRFRKLEGSVTVRSGVNAEFMQGKEQGPRFERACLIVDEQKSRGIRRSRRIVVHSTLGIPWRASLLMARKLAGYL
ncbi:hypothetical protein BSFA1_85110 (plasmid) [Burkholderia sp. SFA1]|nr:hypothetical protein BSFA1_85110 [Burkholderia sp. SFA1]